MIGVNWICATYVQNILLCFGSVGVGNLFSGNLRMFNFHPDLFSVNINLSLMCSGFPLFSQ